MGRWTLDDIPWHEFDPDRIDPDIVPVIKAAGMVEYNAGDYRTYLLNIFADDPRFCAAIAGWAEEEKQHGAALARWARLADPEFDFEARFARFVDGFRLPLEAETSVRGSRTGELLARCMVETGTCNYYSALADATEEPVLKAICRNIAEDEYAHYCLFRTHMARYGEREPLGLWRRLRVLLGRVSEASEDDELSYAYYAANSDGEPYDRQKSGAAYASRAIACCRPAHLVRGTEMIFGALGLRFGGWPARFATRVAGLYLRYRVYLLNRAAA